MAIILKSAEVEWWEFAPIKLATLLIGITIGSTWPELFKRRTRFIVSFGLLLGLYSLCSWIRKWTSTKYYLISENKLQKIDNPKSEHKTWCSRMFIIYIGLVDDRFIMNPYEKQPFW
jgi:hypothetical protein